MTNVDEDNQRYLSLTGVIMDIGHARDHLEPAFNWIKTKVFDHDPDSPLIFHRSDICKRSKCFGVLRNPEKAELFDRAMLRAMQSTEYKVISAIVDKKALRDKQKWRDNHPYHFLMQIIVEKYVQFLKRRNARGDIMPEGRMGKKDVALSSAFTEVCERGTYYVPRQTIAERLTTTQTLKFRYKQDNIAGLQLCDLLAHPSHIYIRKHQNHAVTPGAYALKVIQILLEDKYDRSSTGVLNGYGIKYFP